MSSNDKVKEIAYKDLREYTKEESRAIVKYWYEMECKQPLLCHFLYNLDRILFSFKSLIPWLYGIKFKKKRVWDKNLKDWKWVDIKPKEAQHQHYRECKIREDKYHE